MLKTDYLINIFYIQHVYGAIRILWLMNMVYNTRLFLFSLWTHPWYFKPYATQVWEIISKVAAKTQHFPHLHLIKSSVRRGSLKGGSQVPVVMDEADRPGATCQDSALTAEYYCQGHRGNGRMASSSLDFSGFRIGKSLSLCLKPLWNLIVTHCSCPKWPYRMS